KRPMLVEEPSPETPKPEVADPTVPRSDAPPSAADDEFDKKRFSPHMYAVLKGLVPGHPVEPSPKTCTWCWRDAQDSPEAVTAAFEDAKRQHDKRAKNPRGKDDD